MCMFSPECDFLSWFFNLHLFQYMFYPRTGLHVTNCISNGRVVNIVSFRYESKLCGCHIAQTWVLGGPCKCDPLDPLKSSGFCHLISSRAFSHFLSWIQYSVTSECICIFPLRWNSWLLGYFQPESQTAASLGSLGIASGDGCPPALSCLLSSHIVCREPICMALHIQKHLYIYINRYMVCVYHIYI